MEANYLLHIRDQAFILLILLLVSYLIIPYFGKRKQHIPAIDVIKDIDEFVIVFDVKGEVEFIHNGFPNINMEDHIQQIKTVVEKETSKHIFEGNESINEIGGYFEGELTLMTEKPVYLYYKISLLYSKEACTGKIIVLRNITEHTILIQKLNDKNLELKKAFETQKEYVEITRKLFREEERLKILDIVNNIAKGYLSSLKEKVGLLESKIYLGDDSIKSILDIETERMILITRGTIDEVRSLTKKLFQKA